MPEPRSAAQQLSPLHPAPRLPHLDIHQVLDTSGNDAFGHFIVRVKAPSKGSIKFI